MLDARGMPLTLTSGLGAVALSVEAFVMLENVASIVSDFTAMF